MKKFNKWIGCLIVTLAVNTLAAQQRVTIDCNDRDSLVQNLASELAGYLTRTGDLKVDREHLSKFEDGVIRLRLDPARLPAIHTQGFDLQGNGHSVEITAAAFDGLRNGVYYYLNLLGFRFYLPGEIWTHIPHVNSPFISIDRRVLPAFENRALFPSGGVRKNAVMDPDNSFESNWDNWLGKNLYSSEEKFQGHMGDQFNNRHRKELEANPAMLAEVKGQRKWAANAKWCVSNADFVRLFIDDRLKAYEAYTNKFPDRHYITVEPADGYGDCQCDNCKKMGSVSDRYFYLANVTAEAIEKKFPGGGVSLYAYNTHAAVPEKPVRKNVYVIVIPYLFQNASEPSVLIKMWKEKSAHLGVYDYWGLTGSANDLPLFHYLTEVPQKFRLWKESGLEGFLLETGYSKFNNALAFHFLSQLTWFGPQDIDSSLQVFCRQSFGKASGIMYGMLSRWGIGYRSRIEIPVSFQEVEEAMKKETDPLVQKRLNELHALVTYAALQEDAVSRIAQPDAEKRVDRLFNYIWSIQDMGLINTATIQNQIRRKLILNKRDVSREWDLVAAPQNREFWNRKKSFRLDGNLPDSVRNPMSIDLSLANITYPLNEEREIDSVLNKRHVRPGKDTLAFRLDKQMKFSLLSDDRGALAFTTELQGKAKPVEVMRSAALYDEDNFFLRFIAIPGDFTRPNTIRFDGLKPNTRYRVVIFTNQDALVKIQNRNLILTGEPGRNFKVELVSKQTALLVGSEKFPHYIDPFLYSGQLVRDNDNREFLDKRKKSKKRTEVYSYNPGKDHFLKVNASGKNALSLEVINGETIYIFQEQ